MFSKFTVEYDEKFMQYAVVKWQDVSSTVRSGETVARFPLRTDAEIACNQEIAAFKYELDTADIGCEFDV